VTDNRSRQHGRNRLADARSPYLLQHADNPVDWYPWGEEAFEKASKEDKPIFLSIGYSTCHWCHVMAHESFEDDDVADLMNKNFVNIKVDREERPDIDGVYMQVAQLMTGSGGWPLTIIMTPDRKPFFAGTYIPKISRYNTIGLVDLIPRIADIWKKDRKNIGDVIQRIEQALNESSTEKGSHELAENDIVLAFSELSQRFDEENGGFGTAPKFPSPHNLLLILRYWKRTGDDWALHIVEKTLREMRNGGIFDQVGYGFHRYSTDAHWLVPHFEKMLYDQASLMMAYTETYQITKNPFYANVIRETYEYVTRDLMSPEGAFYSAEDADSEGVEGKFYVWSKEEVDATLSNEENDFFCNYYDIQSDGNYREEASGAQSGLNIPHVAMQVDEFAKMMDVKSGVVLRYIEKAREKLLEVRKTRVRPHRDEKILTDWNAFMVSAIARAGVALNDLKMTQSAEHALSFLLEKMLDSKGNLYHRYSSGEVAYRAFLDDYAYLILALLEVYEATYNPDYLEKARFLSDDMLEYFWDSQQGGLFFTGTYTEELLFRRKNAYDGAMPSGNSIAMFVLIRLARMLGDIKYEEKASIIGRSFSDQVGLSHSSFSMMLVAFDFALGPSYEIVIAGDPDSEDTQKMIQAIGQKFLPRKVLIVRGTEYQRKTLNRLAPFTKFHASINGRATAHVCIDFSCKLPTDKPEQMLRLLGEP
jgi:uncharacterized protein YyaL (SSP411 family)